MTTEQALGVIAVAGGLVAWLLRLEHRQTKVESKGEEHEKSIDRVEENVNYLRNRFDEIFPTFPRKRFPGES